MTNHILILGIAFLLLFSTAGRYSANGAVVQAWVHSGSDEVRGMAIDGSGNLAVTGVSAGGIYTAKYAGTSGALLWQRRHHAVSNAVTSTAALAVDRYGNVVITGVSDGWYTAKYAAADGALLWEKHYSYISSNGFSFGAPSDIALDSSGNVVVTGGSAGDCYTVKYAATDGALVWEKRYTGNEPGHDDGIAIAVDRSDNVIVTASSQRSGPMNDYYTAKYAAADGALLWERAYNSPENAYDSPNGVAVDPSDNVVVTGFSSQQYYTAKYAAATGAVLWEKRYGSGTLTDYSEMPSALAVDRQGNVVVTGYSMNASTNSDYYTAKYAAADGALLWEKHYNSPENGQDQPSAIALDGNDNVIVTGYAGGLSNEEYYWVAGDFYTAKYAGTDGALLWERRYNGSANGFDGAGRLAVGRNGMIVVAGSANINLSPDSDYATIAYWEDVSPAVIDMIPEGPRVRVNGVPGRTYEVQRASVVFGPWTTVAMLVATQQGLVEYVDGAQPAGSAFYRVRTE